MSEHDLALPWADKSKTGQTLSDAKGVPVAVALNYTSVRSRDAEGVTYNTSEYAGPIRAAFIVTAVNSHALLIEALEKVAEARMPGEARSIAYAALTQVREAGQ